MTGKRKVTVFFNTFYSVVALLLASFFAGVQWDAQSLSIVIGGMFAFGGAFMGFNFGEHWSLNRPSK